MAGETMKKFLKKVLTVLTERFYCVTREEEIENAGIHS